MNRARTLLAAALLVLPAAAAAQDVGHDPDKSPYTDLLTHQGFTLFVGRFAGNAGAAGTGARPGLILGTRLQIRLAAPVDLWATFGEAWSSRMTIDASGDTAKVSGNIKVRLLVADLALVLNLTGDKQWHHLAPYVAAGLGIAAPSPNVLDPGGFELGTNFTVVPTIGTRWFVTRSLALRLEARDYYYRYQYPLAYFASTRPFAGHANGSPVLPLDASDRVWYNNFTLWAGVTYGFTF